MDGKRFGQTIIGISSMKAISLFKTGKQDVDIDKSSFNQPETSFRKVVYDYVGGLNEK